jgi:hypothetical protein
MVAAKIGLPLEQVFKALVARRHTEGSLHYYDGLIPAPKGLTIKVVGQNVSLLSQAKDPVHDVTVIDLRNAGKIRVARLDKMEPGAEVKEVLFTEGDHTKWPSEPVAVLVRQLQSAGLHEDEARSLATVWRKDSFNTQSQACSLPRSFVP